MYKIQNSKVDLSNSHQTNFDFLNEKKSPFEVLEKDRPRLIENLQPSTTLPLLLQSFRTSLLSSILWSRKSYLETVLLNIDSKDPLTKKLDHQ